VEPLTWTLGLLGRVCGEDYLCQRPACLGSCRPSHGLIF
jgi:hypothetical protein